MRAKTGCYVKKGNLCSSGVDSEVLQRCAKEQGGLEMADSVSKPPMMESG